MPRLKILFAAYRVEIWLIVSGIGVLLGFAITQRVLLSDTTAPSFVHLLGVPLDDVYIHCRFAQNLLNGWSFSFNPGSTLTGDTSPLWVLLIAIGGLLTPHLELVAIFLSAVAYLIIGPGVYRTARDVFRMKEPVARLAGFASVVTGRLAWGAMSGMETTLAALLTLLVVEEHLRQRRKKLLRSREAVILGIGLLTRPEFFFIALVLSVDWIFIIRKERQPAAPLAFSMLALFASIIVLLPLVTSGRLAFHSSVVQGARVSVVPDVGYLWFALRIIVSDNVVLFLMLLLALPMLWNSRDCRLPLVISFGLPLLQAFVAPQFRHHGRYLFIIFPLISILGAASVDLIFSRRSGLPQKAFRFVFLLILLAGVLETGRWAILESESVRNINDQHLAATNWFRSRQADSRPIAADDVGAIGYITHRPIVDLTGLMTPEIYASRRDPQAIWKYARLSGATEFLIYNRLNPEFYQQYKDSLVLQQEFRVRKPLISAADTVMSLYRIRGED